MAEIPGYQAIMLPLLQLAADGEVRRFRDAVEMLASQFALNSEQLTELLPSGQQPVFENRVGWAKTYLKQAGVLEYPSRGEFRITQRGQDLLAENPDFINVKLLKRFDEFRKFQERRPDEPLTDNREDDDADSPEDQMAKAFARLRTAVKAELLELLKDTTPAYFERIVVDVLVAMGYGGNRQGAARAVGKSSDGGIDGVIDEDRLGLDVIYIQAKKWEGPVSRPEIQKFAGALQGRRARKGVFISTSRFTMEAVDYARSIESKVVLIDGDRLTDLMIEYDVGVSREGAYILKSVDADYFEE